MMQAISNFVSLPLRRRTRKCVIPLNEVQETTRLEILRKIESGEYALASRPCLCGSRDEAQDQCLLQVDRYGVSGRMLLCRRCGLMRTDPAFDEESLKCFYRDEFSLLHRGTCEPHQPYLDYVLPTGEQLHAFLAHRIPDREVTDVLEIGCATGANLLPFFRSGKSVTGFDYDANFLDYGRRQGLSLTEGPWEGNVRECSQDLIILNHVLEHFTDPVGDMLKIAALARPGKYIYVEVPGYFSIHRRWKGCPTKYHQSDHIFHFHRDYLEVFFRALGLEVVQCDEWCRCLLRKPSSWNPVAPQYILEDNMDAAVPRILRYFKDTYIRHAIVRAGARGTELLGIKKPLKKLLLRR